MKATFKRNSTKIKVSLLSTLMLAHGVAIASELSISDKGGSSFLRVEASNAKEHDIQVLFKNSTSKIPAGMTLSLRSSVDSSLDKTINISDAQLSQGVVIPDVDSGKYTLTLSSEEIQIKEVKIVDADAIASAKSESSSIGATTYAVGAAALGGAALAVSSGGGDDIFGGGSNGNSARTGSGNNSGSNTTSGTGSGNSENPSVGALVVTDPNYPTATPAFFPRPSATVVASPPPARDTTGGGVPTPTPTPAPNPPVAPPPANTDPMTPS